MSTQVDFLGARRKVAGDVLQRHVGDGDIEYLQMKAASPTVGATSQGRATGLRAADNAPSRAPSTLDIASEAS